MAQKAKIAYRMERHLNGQYVNDLGVFPSKYDASSAMYDEVTNQAINGGVRYNYILKTIRGAQ